MLESRLEQKPDPPKVTEVLVNILLHGVLDYFEASFIEAEAAARASVFQLLVSEVNANHFIDLTKSGLTRLWFRHTEDSPDRPGRCRARSVVRVPSSSGRA